MLDQMQSSYTDSGEGKKESVIQFNSVAQCSDDCSKIYLEMYPNS